uniref:Uncharacterized protein n=1 Tax=Pithovirus LCDPAC02 TaxID=2506601 RepID=A0A481YR96_9VIRU|nr:MAG: hypothetical protein LCDPAC02_01750 [Pithovirus LCDPAC02]
MININHKKIGTPIVNFFRIEDDKLLTIHLIKFNNNNNNNNNNNEEDIYIALNVEKKCSCESNINIILKNMTKIYDKERFMFLLKYDLKFTKYILIYENKFLIREIKNNIKYTTLFEIEKELYNIPKIMMLYSEKELFKLSEFKNKILKDYRKIKKIEINTNNTLLKLIQIKNKEIINIIERLKNTKTILEFDICEIYQEILDHYNFFNGLL